MWRSQQARQESTKTTVRRRWGSPGVRPEPKAPPACQNAALIIVYKRKLSVPTRNRALEQQKTNVWRTGRAHAAPLESRG